MAARNPSSWDDHERGLSPNRTISVLSSTGVEEDAAEGAGEDASLLDNDDDIEQWDGLSGMRRRRSSVTNRLTALTDLGGVNSIRSFTRSWQRAAGFVEVIPQRPSFVFAPDQAPIVQGQGSSETIHYSRGNVEPTPQLRTSLLREHLEATPPQATSSSIQQIEAAASRSSDEVQSQGQGQGQTQRDFREQEAKALEAELDGAFRSRSHSGSSHRPSIFAIPPHLATPPIVGSYSSFRSYGTFGSGLDRRPSLQQVWQEPQEEGVRVGVGVGVGGVGDEELPPIMVKEVEQDGKIVLAVEGQSTLPQTVFNSINVLIGVGLLSLPLGIKYAGWVCGMIALLLCALVTSYTAKLLGKCMDLDPSLITFSDLAYISFGRNARIATSILFTLELMAANVALVVLFADSLDLLFPAFISVAQWKIVCTIVLIPLNFMPLSLLSFTSVIGIFSCFGIVSIVVLDGFIKPHSPGSLLEPATTYMFPARWSTLPLSFGLLLSPWGGHSVFPNIYRDMRHPYKYGQALKTTFTFTYILDATTAVAGILMFGDGVRDEITSNILKTSGYPTALTVLMCVFIAIIPLTKIPLNARPIINTLEVIAGIHQPYQHQRADIAGPSSGSVYRALVKVLVRVFTLVCFLVISILFPAFDSIMAFMGSALCFAICVILPLAFYLKLFKNDISKRERLFAYFLIVISTILSTIGTIWAFLPKSLIGAE